MLTVHMAHGLIAGYRLMRAWGCCIARTSLQIPDVWQVIAASVSHDCLKSGRSRAVGTDSSHGQIIPDTLLEKYRGIPYKKYRGILRRSLFTFWKVPPRNTTVYQWYTVVFRGGTIVQYHGIPWYCRLPCYTVVHCTVVKSTAPKHHGTFCTMVFRGGTFYHGTMYHGIP